jgi:hypothetical protein
MTQELSLPTDREVFEQIALERICACQYYDLADCIEETTDDELSSIIEGTFRCDMCGTN